jgi:hypothetical protein
LGGLAAGGMAFHLGGEGLGLATDALRSEPTGPTDAERLNLMAMLQERRADELESRGRRAALTRDREALSEALMADTLQQDQYEQMSLAMLDQYLTKMFQDQNDLAIQILGPIRR